MGIPTGSISKTMMKKHVPGPMQSATGSFSIITVFNYQYILKILLFELQTKGIFYLHDNKSKYRPGKFFIVYLNMKLNITKWLSICSLTENEI